MDGSSPHGVTAPLKSACDYSAPPLEGDAKVHPLHPSPPHHFQSLHLVAHISYCFWPRNRDRN